MSPNKAQAREAARHLLKELKIASAPTPIERIIKRKQIVLRYAPLENDVSGMAYINDGVAIIGVNALHPPNRQRFSAAHELGHHLLHNDLLKERVHIDKQIGILHRNEISSLGTDWREIEANAFASELLMPTDLLLQELQKDVNIFDEDQTDALAKKFRVSASAMGFRLANLNETTVA